MLAFDDLTFEQRASDEEWDRGEKMRDFLRPFYMMTNLISGSSYLTFNLYLMEVWKISCLLKKHSTSEDEVVRQMTIKMKEKFNKYWVEFSEILAMGSVFDSRVKLTFLGYCYQKLIVFLAKKKLIS